MIHDRPAADERESSLKYLDTRDSPAADENGKFIIILISRYTTDQQQTKRRKFIKIY